MSNAEKAAAVFKEGFSCSQAVLAAYCERFGLDRDTAMKISTGFGGGMHLRQTCGVVTGAIMAIGLKYGRTKADDQASKAKTYEIVAEFANEFKRRHGSITCLELIGCDITTPEGMQQARDKKLFASVCTKLITTATEILDRIL